MTETTLRPSAQDDPLGHRRQAEPGPGNWVVAGLVQALIPATWIFRTAKRLVCAAGGSLVPPLWESGHSSCPTRMSGPGAVVRFRHLPRLRQLAQPATDPGRLKFSQLRDTLKREDRPWTQRELRGTGRVATGWTWRGSVSATRREQTIAFPHHYLCRDAAKTAHDTRPRLHRSDLSVGIVQGTRAADLGAQRALGG